MDPHNDLDFVPKEKENDADHNTYKNSTDAKKWEGYHFGHIMDLFHRILSLSKKSET